MADPYSTKREVAWYTEEVRKNEREMDAATRAVPLLKRKLELEVREAEKELSDAKRKLEDNKRKLEGYQRDLKQLELAANDNTRDAGRGRRAA